MTRTTVALVHAGATIDTSATNGLISNDLDHEARLAVVEGAVINVAAHGVVGDALTDNTSAIQSLMNRNCSASVNGQNFTKVLYFPPGVYKTGPLIIRDRLILLGSRMFGQGHGEGTTRLVATGVPSGGYLINQEDAGTVVDQFSMVGFNVHGGGATTLTGCVNLPNMYNGIFSSLYLDNWGIESFVVGGGNCRVSYSFFSGLFNRSAITRDRGAFTITGQDHQISHCEMTGSSQVMTSSSALHCQSAYINCGNTEFDSCVFQVGDIGAALQGSASHNRFAACRFDTNAGHGLALLGTGTDNSFTGCHWGRNSASENNLYDHIFAVAGGPGRTIFTSPILSNYGSTVRYCINDGVTSAKYRNLYVTPSGSAGLSGFYHLTGLSSVVFPSNAPTPLVGTSPSVLNLQNVYTANLVATSITNFLDGVDGQQLLILNGDGGKTMVKPGPNLVLSANLPLKVTQPLRLIRYRGNWVQT